MLELVSHHGSAATGPTDLGEPRPPEHGKRPSKDGRWRRGTGEPIGVNGMAVEHGSAVFRSPIHSCLQQRSSGASPTVFATHRETGHPPGLRVVIKNLGKCSVGDDPTQRRARHYPRPTDHAVTAVGQ